MRRVAIETEPRRHLVDLEFGLPIRVAAVRGDAAAHDD